MIVFFGLIILLIIIKLPDFLTKIVSYRPTKWHGIEATELRRWNDTNERFRVWHMVKPGYWYVDGSRGVVKESEILNNSHKADF